MKTLNIKILAIVILSVTLTSCEKVVTNVDLPDAEQQLVIQSFISPQDDITKVWVSLSTPVFSETPYDIEEDFLDNATVVISDGATSKTLVFKNSKNYYYISSLDFPIVAGKTYTLNVSTPDGKKCDAMCTVPLSNPLSFELVSIDTNTYDDDYGFLKTRFKDISGEKNYYRVFAYDKRPHAGDTIYNELYPEYGNEVFTDINNDGNWLNQTFHFYNNIKILVFNILNVDKHYYSYHKSVIGNEDGNPFSEPVIVYSNVNNGLGVFCAYNSLSEEIDVK